MATLTHPEAYQLLSPLMANNPEDSAVKDRATTWLDGNPQHPQQSHLLRTLIVRSSGAEEWLRRGVAYLKQPSSKHPQNILGALLVAGKAASEYVELAVNYLEGGAAKKHKGVVFGNLAKTLAHNPERAFEYLNGVFPDSRKATVCKAISRGLKRHPHTVNNFIEKWPYLSHSKYQGWVLAGLIYHKVQSPELDLLVVNWLNQYYRHPGYGRLLNTLRTDLDRRALLEASGMLSEQIVEDLNTLQP